MANLQKQLTTPPAEPEELFRCILKTQSAAWTDCEIAFLFFSQGKRRKYHVIGIIKLIRTNSQ